jgi:hypothetical protein
MIKIDSGFWFSLAFILVLAAFLAGILIGEKNIKKEAVLNGHAVWGADAQGDSKFQWNEIKQTDKK